MAVNDNMFALLGGDDVGNLTSHSAANAAAVVNRRETRNKALPSSQPPSAAVKPLASLKFFSKPQRSTDHAGSDRARHVNGVKRSNENGVKRYDGHDNGNNRGGSDFKRNNAYRHDERPNGALNRTQYEKRPNGSLNRKQYENRPNGSLNRKQYEKQCIGEETTNGGDGWEVVLGRRHKCCDRTSVGETERYHSKDDDKEYRMRRRSNSGGNNGGFNGGRRPAVAGEGNDNGFSSASIEEANAGSKGHDEAANEASKESEKHDEDHRQERRMAEREMEAKRMTLSQYEKKLQEKRKGLESMKAHEERIATLDKDFESMLMIEKKNQETTFVKMESDNDKLKKKVTTHNKNVDKITNFKIAGTNLTRRLSGRYNRVEKGNVVESVIKKAPLAPPSPHDAKEFPALGTTKE